MQWPSFLISVAGAFANSVAAIYNCSSFVPGPLSTSDLAAQFIPGITTDLASVESIRSTLLLYSLAVDGKNWDVLDNVFTPDARANYSKPLGVLEGLPNIKSSLSNFLDAFPHTQHHLSTSIINTCGDSAVSVTYLTAAHFLTDELGPTVANDNKAVYAHGMYQDTWNFQNNNTWKIFNRNLIFMVSI
ncbi:hypothetical protein BX600DRAFT_435680 [Xylariales sp. PMI_506]|nr:hypothetical protein BX600DRAFT_435680 [Xylariales sp. PMI_506]